MPDQTTLAIETRPERGPEARRLRRAGRTPGIVYGYRIDPLPIKMDTREFSRAFHKAGRTQLIDLVQDGTAPRKVLVREVQYDPRLGGVMHVDFYAVNLLEKISADVPITLVGEAPAVERREGELLQTMQTLHVTCLPTDIPEHVEVDISGLEAVDDAVRVGQLQLPDDVEVGNDPEDVVVKIAHIREAEVEEVPEVAEEGAEGEAVPAEGESAPGGEGAEAPAEE
jgi:large subunit ribosomal protein L25